MIARTLYITGFLNLYKSTLLRNKVIVLMYHRVLTANESQQSCSHPGIIVDRDLFDKQIEFISNNFNPITIKQFCDWINKKISLPKNSCLITFDDGWSDNYTNAYPILEKYKVPAVIFIATNYIGSGDIFWQEKITSFLIGLSGSTRNHIPFLQEIGLENYPADSTEKLYIRKYVTELKDESQEKIDAVLEKITSYSQNNHTGVSNSSIDNFMDWNQVSELSCNGISIGSHTCSHTMLTKLSTTEVVDEATESRDILQQKLDVEISSIAYPNGNFNTSVVESVRDAGYEIAFTTREGYITQSDDRFRLKRINIHTYTTRTMPLFFCRMLNIL